VKPVGARQESDGVVVPLIAGMNPVGGKGPDFDHNDDEGKCESMTETAQSNNSTRGYFGLTGSGPVKARRLRNRLWAAAKQSSGRRFHALYDRVYRSDILWMAWERVRENRGSAGVDNITLADVEDYGG
jgi:RNA-directed DNA polymerase